MSWGSGRKRELLGYLLGDKLSNDGGKVGCYFLKFEWILDMVIILFNFYDCLMSCILFFWFLFYRWENGVYSKVFNLK